MPPGQGARERKVRKALSKTEAKGSAAPASSARGSAAAAARPLETETEHADGAKAKLPVRKEFAYDGANYTQS